MRPADGLIYLCRCAVNGETPERMTVEQMDLPAVYALAGQHMLSAVAAMAVESCGIRDTQTAQMIARAQRKAVLFEQAYAEVSAALEKAGIWYMPLKGIVIQKDYPRFGMREMSDHDVLFNAEKAAEVKTVMRQQGFSVESFGKGTHDIYHKPPTIAFEMHRVLFPTYSGEGFGHYYSDVKSRLIQDGEDGFGYHFRPEDCYIYLIAHEYKHFSSGGTGLRSLLDTYVYLKKHADQMDMAYINGEMDKLGLVDFEKQNRNLARHLFGDELLTPEDRQMLDYIMGSGTYGTTHNRVMNKVNRLGGEGKGKAKYIWQRLCPSMASLYNAYPFFNRHKLLLPLLPFVRLWRALTVSRKIVKAEVKALAERNGKG